MGWLKELISTGKSELGSAKAVVSDATQKIEYVIKMNVILATLNLIVIILLVVFISRR